jgi:circadian clock protein KaiC
MNERVHNGSDKKKSASDGDFLRISTGNAGFDSILGGGLPRDRVYLLEGSPGSGKTTLALQFLLEGVRHGERGLYVTLSETREELQSVAASHGWDLETLDVFELSSADEVLGQEREQSVLHSWELELGGTIKLIRDQVERVKPNRVVFDSLSELRLLAEDALRYRRQVLALKQFFAGGNTTVFLVDDLTTVNGERDTHLHSLCHGVITLERLTLDFGATRRRMEIQKLRGISYIGGFHDFIIRKGGIDIFPRLIASDHRLAKIGGPTPSGVAELDALLNGGPLGGTSTLLAGPPGAGKTTIALQYIDTACRRGDRCAIYQFDERVGTLLLRARSFGLDLEKHIEDRRLVIEQIDPAELSPGEFASRLQHEVEANSCRMIVIDSLNGYLASMPQEQHLVLQLHELLSYLNEKGVTTFLIIPHQGLVGVTAADIDISYIADVVILMRFFEAEGRIRKAISILKNRSGAHEDTIREFRIDARGIRVGEPLREFTGVLTGSPHYLGSATPLMEDRRRES